MHSSKHFSPNVTCSRLRTATLACMLMLGTFAVQAQSATDPASPASPPSRIGPPAATDSLPRNRYSEQDLQAAFQRADTNQDGKLSRDEAEHFPAMAQRFELIDTDRDTFISLAELARAAGS